LAAEGALSALEAGGAESGWLASRVAFRPPPFVASRPALIPRFGYEVEHIFARNAAIERERLAAVRSGAAALFGAGSTALGSIGYSQDKARNPVLRGIPLNNNGAPRRDFRTGVPISSAPRRDFRTIGGASRLDPNSSQSVSS